MRLKALLIIGLFLITLSSACLPAYAASDPGYYYDSVNVDISVEQNGDIRVYYQPTIKESGCGNDRYHAYSYNLAQRRGFGTATAIA